MNVKKFVNVLFYLIGTCIIISISSVVALNIFADSKLFEKKQVEEPKQQEASNEKGQKIIQPGTFKYQRDYEEEEVVVKKKEVKPKETPKVEPINVVLLDQSGFLGVAEKLKTTLEERGFIVTLEKGEAIKSSTTKILEHNDKGLAIQLQKALKMGKIVKDTQVENKTDLTLVLGQDYSP